MSVAVSRTARSKSIRLRARTKRRLRWLGIVGVVVLAVAAFAWWAAHRPGQSVPTLGNKHLATENEPHIPYNSDPPTSGPHFNYIAHWGIHTEPIPRELQVHNLEDGGVLVQYRCPAGCPDLVQKLAAVVTRHRWVILAPYPGMDHRLALTAWARIDKFDTFDEGRIARFIAAYEGIDHHPHELFN
jgi:Protein of unknown function (DUF3105)